jgi:mRNA interferase MazF
VVSRGEVWWVEHPEFGRRPHLVVTRQPAIPALERYLAVPATSKVRGIPTEVELTRAEGMPRDCVLSLDNLTVIPREFFIERVCRLSAQRMREVCLALIVATGC